MNNPFLKHPIKSLFASLLIIAPLIFAAKVNFNASTAVLLAGDQRNLQTYNQVAGMLNKQTLLVIVIEMKQVFSNPGLQKIRRLSTDLAKLPGVTTVKSLTNMKYPVRQGFSLQLKPFIPTANLSADTLIKLQKKILKHPLLRNILISADKKHALVMAMITGKFDSSASQAALQKKINKFVENHSERNFKLKVLSFPGIENEVRETLRNDLTLFIPVALLTLITILFFTFRSLRLITIILSLQALALVLLPGLFDLNQRCCLWLSSRLPGLGFLGNMTGSITLYTSMLFPLVSAVHLTFMVHLFSEFQFCRKTTSANKEALVKALTQVIKPSLLAATTTLIGLLSLLSCDSNLVQEFALVSAQGIALCFFLTFGPATSIVLLAELKTQSNNAITKTWSDFPVKFLGKITKFRTVFIFLPLAVVLISLPALTLLRTDIRAEEFLNPQSPIRQAAKSINDYFGGINLLKVKVKVTSGQTINSPECLNFVDKLHKYAESQAEISAVYSYALLFKLLNSAWQGKEEMSPLPQNPATLALFSNLIELKEFPFLEHLRSKNKQSCFLLIRSPYMAADRYLKALTRVNDFAKKNVPNNLSCSFAKGIHSVLEADRALVHNQIKSLTICFLVVFFLLLVIWHSAKTAALVSLCNLIPIVMMLSTAVLFAIPLNSITVMVAAVVFGIAVDDSVHFIAYYRQFLKDTDSETALKNTLEVKLKPIVCTSLVLITMLGLFLLWSFPPVVHFGLLAAFALLIALYCTLTLLPALLTKN